MVKKMKTTLILALLVTVSAHCQREKYPFDITGLTYRNKLVYNNQFRIDGFYYSKIDTSKEHIYVMITYFFRDGTYCIFDVEASKLLNLTNNDFIDIPEGIRKIPYCWGAYIIENDIVKIQIFDSYRDVFEKFKIMENWAKITNDTTLNYFKELTMRGTERKINGTYHFKKCSAKPDSTNVLMKY
jgi:hypothetical protein